MYSMYLPGHRCTRWGDLTDLVILSNFVHKCFHAATSPRTNTTKDRGRQGGSQGVSYVRCPVLNVLSSMSCGHLCRVDFVESDVLLPPPLSNVQCPMSGSFRVLCPFVPNVLLSSVTFRLGCPFVFGVLWTLGSPSPSPMSTPHSTSTSSQLLSLSKSI